MGVTVWICAVCYCVNQSFISLSAHSDFSFNIGKQLLADVQQRWTSVNVSHTLLHPLTRLHTHITLLTDPWPPNGLSARTRGSALPASPETHCVVAVLGTDPNCSIAFLLLTQCSGIHFLWVWKWYVCHRCDCVPCGCPPPDKRPQPLQALISLDADISGDLHFKKLQGRFGLQKGSLLPGGSTMPSRVKELQVF